MQGLQRKPPGCMQAFCLFQHLGMKQPQSPMEQDLRLLLKEHYSYARDSTEGNYFG